jgi:hypothetical protein
MVGFFFMVSIDAGAIVSHFTTISNGELYLPGVGKLPFHIFV